MKKFRKGDVIALKINPSFIYIVAYRKGGGWIGYVHPDHKNYNPNGDSSMEFYLADNPGAWKVVTRAPSEKDMHISDLQAKLEVAKAEKEAQVANQQLVDRDRDLDMLAAGWVSIERLRRNTLQDVVKRYDGVGPFPKIEICMKQPQGDHRDAVYIREYLKALTRQE